MNNYTLNVTLTLQGPLLTSGGGDINRGLNKIFFKNALGEPVLQASHIKGKLLEALRELSQSGAVTNLNLAELFGIENAEGMYGHPLF